MVVILVGGDLGRPSENIIWHETPAEPESWTAKEAHQLRDDDNSSGSIKWSQRNLRPILALPGCVEERSRAGAKIALPREQSSLVFYSNPISSTIVSSLGLLVGSGLRCRLSRWIGLAYTWIWLVPRTTGWIRSSAENSTLVHTPLANAGSGKVSERVAAFHCWLWPLRQTIR